MIDDDDLSWREIAETAIYSANGWHEELVDIGLRQGALCRADYKPFATAVWDCMPDGVRVGGAVWNAIETGARTAYGIDQDRDFDPFWLGDEESE